MCLSLLITPDDKGDSSTPREPTSTKQKKDPMGAGWRRLRQTDLPALS
jgi:hypothetical protein